MLYVNELSVLDGFTPVYEPDGFGFYLRDVSADGYRLPTEAEWEYMARAGQGTTYAGSDTIDDVGWYDANSLGSSQEVAQFPANANGLYDITGNVYELCWDWRDDEYYDVSPSIDPTGPVEGTHWVAQAKLSHY